MGSPTSESRGARGPRTLRAGVLASVLTLTVTLAVGSGLAQTGRKALSKQDVVELLRSGVSPTRVEDLARQYGVSFELTPEVEDDLLAAGATQPLLNALRELSRKASTPPPAPEAVLLIEASPGGAQVYVDDEAMGTTSTLGRLKIPRLKPGEHQLRLSLAGYQDFEQKITLESGEAARIFAKLEPLKSAAPEAPVAPPASRAPLEQQSEEYERIAQSVGPAIVHIAGTLANGQRNLGSGVTISPEGYVVTNWHIVSGANAITVTLADRRVLEAKVVGFDGLTDLALLQVPAANLPTVRWGDSSTLGAGALVLALANPLGQGPTVTRGVVSTATGPARAGLTEGFIQTDAAINPGNSGGALVNLRGEMVGINTAIIAPGRSTSGTATAEKIGFAIPSRVARPVVEALRTRGRVERGYLGISISNLTPEMAQLLNSPDTSGALVNDVMQGSPGERAGLKAGDILRMCNGAPLATADQLIATVANQSPGTSVNLTYWRDGQVSTATLVLAERPAATPVLSARQDCTGDPNREIFEEFFGKAQRRVDPQVTRGALRGVAVRVPPAAARPRLGLPAAGHGVFVTGLDPACPAAQAGLQRGDVIESVNRRPLKSADDFREVAEEAARAGRRVLLRVNRRGNAFFLAVSPESR